MSSDMSKKEKTIKEYYQDQRMSDDSIDQILDRGRQVAQDRQAAPINRERFFTVSQIKLGALAFAASFLLAIVISQTYFFTRSTTETTELVLAEIAMNHNKRLNVEYPYQEFQKLQVAMDRLDFKLTPMIDLPGKFSLLGGRYCSIQGKLAAQLKVKDIDSGNIATLYVTPSTNKLQKVANQQVVFDNVTIRTWQDGKNFYGLATDG